MQRVKQIPFTRVFRSSKTSVLFIYVYTISIGDTVIGETVHIGVETRRMRSSNVSRSDSRQWICAHPVDGAVYRTIPTSSRRDTRTCVYGQSQGVLWSNASRREEKIYIYIYKLAFFASIRINKSSRGINALRAYLYVREIERISTVLPCFPPRALPLRSQTSGKSSEIFINLKESYNIYKIIFYSKIYFIIFSQ